MSQGGSGRNNAGKVPDTSLLISMLGGKPKREEMEAKIVKRARGFGEMRVETRWKTSDCWGGGNIQIQREGAKNSSSLGSSHSTGPVRCPRPLTGVLCAATASGAELSCVRVCFLFFCFWLNRTGRTLSRTCACLRGRRRFEDQVSELEVVGGRKS